MKLPLAKKPRTPKSVAEIMNPVLAARIKAVKQLEEFEVDRALDADAIHESIAELSRKAAVAAAEAQDAAKAREALLANNV